MQHCICDYSETFDLNTFFHSLAASDPGFILYVFPDPLTTLNFSKLKLLYAVGPYFLHLLIDSLLLLYTNISPHLPHTSWLSLGSVTIHQNVLPSRLMFA